MLLSYEEMSIVSGQWLRYSDKNLEADILFFTSSEQAANGYREMYMAKAADILQFSITGPLKLINVSEYLLGKDFRPAYNILNENNERKDSTPERAEDERQFYRELKIFAKQDLGGIDGFFTPRSKFHHDEMVLLNENIKTQLQNFSPFESNPSGTPTRARDVVLQIEDREVRIARRNVKSAKRIRLHF